MDSSIFMFVEREIPVETTERVEGEKDHLLSTGNVQDVLHI